MDSACFAQMNGSSSLLAALCLLFEVAPISYCYRPTTMQIGPPGQQQKGPGKPEFRHVAAPADATFGCLKRLGAFMPAIH
jgi:hypothetical protein